jgi:hypothetical protein
MGFYKYFTYHMTDIFGIMNLYIMLLGTREFHENWYTENHNLFRVYMKFGHDFCFRLIWIKYST